MIGETSSREICEDIIPVSEQSAILTAAGLAHRGHHVAAERERCYGGYDVGVMAAEGKAGR